MNERALQRFADQMAAAVEAGRVTPAQALSVMGQAMVDAAGHGSVVPRDTRNRNRRRTAAALERRGAIL